MGSESLEVWYKKANLLSWKAHGRVKKSLGFEIRQIRVLNLSLLLTSCMALTTLQGLSELDFSIWAKETLVPVSYPWQCAPGEVADRLYLKIQNRKMATKLLKCEDNILKWKKFSRAIPIFPVYMQHWFNLQVVLGTCMGFSNLVITLQGKPPLPPKKKIPSHPWFSGLCPSSKYLITQ